MRGKANFPAHLSHQAPGTRAAWKWLTPMIMVPAPLRAVCVKPKIHGWGSNVDGRSTKNRWRTVHYRRRPIRDGWRRIIGRRGHIHRRWGGHINRCRRHNDVRWNRHRQANAYAEVHSCLAHASGTEENCDCYDCSFHTSIPTITPQAMFTTPILIHNFFHEYVKVSARLSRSRSTGKSAQQPFHLLKC
jgi:hypothetical protein